MGKLQHVVVDPVHLGLQCHSVLYKILLFIDLSFVLFLK